MRGLRITPDGRFEPFDYLTERHIFRNTFYPIDFYELIEIFEVDDVFCYEIYASIDSSLDINQFDLQSRIVYGDILIVGKLNRCSFTDINQTDFRNSYTQAEVLDDYLLEDELSASVGSYDFNDGFLVPDY